MSDEVLTSSWCTAWDSYNTPRLWSMVMNEDDTVGRAQVSAWRTLAGSVSDQRAALVAAKAELVAAWPPEQNASAAAFVLELDTLIARLDLAAADAQSTATGLDRIMNALQTAKREIEPLWEQYKDKSDDLVPRWFDSAEDELDEQARRAMIAAEAAVQDSVPLLKVPEPYRLQPREGEGGNREFPTGGESTLSGGNSGLRAGSGVSGGGIDVPVPHDPVPPLPGRDPIVPGIGSGEIGAVPGVGGGGPDLAGVINPLPPVVPPGGGGIGPLPGVGGGPLPGGGPNPIAPGLTPIVPGGFGVGGTPLPGGRGLRPTTGGVIGDRTALGRPGLGEGGGARPIGSPPLTGGVGAPGGRAPARGRIGAGGVIGMNGEASRGGNAAFGGGAARGNPGAGGSTAARGGAGARGATPAPRPSWLPNDPVGPNRHASAAGQRPGARGRHTDGEQPVCDPDNPWQVAEGVRPVISPGALNERNDPGPHVIGRHG